MSLLEIRDLVKSYVTPEGERTTIVHVPSLRIEAGEQVGLEGQSGSGKTTLLNLIAGILEADSGSIRIDGEDLVALSEPARDRLRARAIGYVFQSFHLLPAYTALENVLLGMMFGPGPDPAWARHLLVRVGLGDRLAHKPSELSVGQQQRVALARGLANRPKLCLADEPTGNLDPARAAEAIELVREVCRENRTALLLVSHDPAILARFPRVERIERLAQGAALGGAATR